MTKSDFIEHTDPALDELQSKAESILATIRNIRNRQEPSPVLDISEYFATSVHSIAYTDKGLPVYACNREDLPRLVYSLVFRDQLTGKPYRVDTEIDRGNNKKILSDLMNIIVNQHAMDIKLYAISTLYKQTNKSQGTDIIASINELSKTYNGFFDDESVLGYLFKLRTIKDPLIAFDCTDDHFYERSRQDMIDIIHAEPKKD